MSTPTREDSLLAGFDQRPSLQIARVQSDEEMLEVLEIRRRVFAAEQHVPDLRVSDPDDARSLTALARLRLNSAYHDEWRTVSTGRLTPWPAAGGPALIAWVATIPEFRGQGIGRQVMRYLLDAADSSGIGQVSLSAQAPAEPFYHRLGFLAAGSRYDVRGIPHVRMVRRRPA